MLWNSRAASCGEGDEDERPGGDACRTGAGSADYEGRTRWGDGLYKAVELEKEEGEHKG